jgi:hypothetical protein
LAPPAPRSQNEVGVGPPQCWRRIGAYVLELILSIKLQSIENAVNAGSYILKVTAQQETETNRTELGQFALVHFPTAQRFATSVRLAAGVWSLVLDNKTGISSSDQFTIFSCVTP